MVSIWISSMDVGCGADVSVKSIDVDSIIVIIVIMHG